MSEDQLVSWRLGQIESRIKSMDEKLDAVSDEVIGLRGKASGWGLLSGGLMAILTTVAAKLLIPK